MAFVPPVTTKTTTSHGVAIFASGIIVGGISSWEPSQTKALTMVFELGAVTDPDAISGEPYEIVPGNITGQEIRITRYDLYTKKFERAFSSDDLLMLTRQTVPISFREFTASPDGTLNEVIQYVGCWFSNIGRQLRADDNRIIRANASAMYQRKQRVT